MLVIYELSSDVAPMSNYLSGELHRAPKLGGLGFDLLFRFLLLSHAGGKTYAMKILSAWNEKPCDSGRTSKGRIPSSNIENFASQFDDYRSLRWPHFKAVSDDNIFVSYYRKLDPLS